MEIPQSAMDALRIARESASTRLLPGQGHYEALIDRNVSRGLGAARESAASASELTQAATGMVGAQNDSVLTMALQGAENHVRNTRALEAQLGAMANWEQLQFNMNEMMPWQDKIQDYLADAETASAMTGAGLQNIMGGLDMAGGMLTQKNTTKWMEEMLEKIAKGEGNGNGSQQFVEAINNPQTNINLPSASGNVPSGSSFGIPPMNQGDQMFAMFSQYLQQLGQMKNLHR